MYEHVCLRLFVKHNSRVMSGHNQREYLALCHYPSTSKARSADLLTDRPHSTISSGPAVTDVLLSIGLLFLPSYTALGY